MPFSLLPKRMTKALTDVTPELLRSRNIRLLMLDFDNTIVPYTTDVPTQAMEHWLKNMNAQEDIQVCIVSNSHNDRVPAFCEKYGIPAGQAALVGDQIYTDTLGANCMGVTSILVKAIDNHTFWLKARHVLELPFIFLAGNRRFSQ